MEKTVISKDQQDVLKVESMTQAFNSKDIDGVMSSYRAGAMVIFEPETPVADYDQLREMFLGAFTISPKFEFHRAMKSL